MKKIEKMFLTPKWQEIKAMYEKGTNGSNEYGNNFPIDGELDELTQHFIGYLLLLTQEKGFDCIVEDVKMDLWKERIWAVVENAGLLPNIAWRDEKEIEEYRDSFENNDDEFDVDLEAQSFETFGFN
jgi:hypothetical protein